MDSNTITPDNEMKRARLGILGILVLGSFACDQPSKKQKAKKEVKPTTTIVPASKQAPIDDPMALLKNKTWACEVKIKNAQGVSVNSTSVVNYFEDGTATSSNQSTTTSPQFQKLSSKDKKEVTLGFRLKSLIKHKWALKKMRLTYSTFQVAIDHGAEVTGVVVPSKNTTVSNFIKINKAFDTPPNKFIIEAAVDRFAFFTRSFKTNVEKETSTVEIVKLNETEAMFKSTTTGAISSCKLIKKLNKEETNTAQTQFNTKFDTLRAKK